MAQRDPGPVLYLLNEFEGIDGKSLEAVYACMLLLLSEHVLMFRREADAAMLIGDMETADKWRELDARAKETINLAYDWPDSMDPIKRHRIAEKAEKLLRRLRRGYHD